MPSGKKPVPVPLVLLFEGRDFDGGDEGNDTFEFGVAFGDDAEGGEFVIAEFIGEEAEPPAQDDDIGGGKGDGQFLRRLVLVVTGIGVWFEGVINQLAGVEATAMVFILVELDAGGVSVGGLVTGIFEEGGRGGHDVFLVEV